MTEERDIAKLQESLRLAQAELAKVREQLEDLMEEKASADAVEQGARPVGSPDWRGRAKRLLRRLGADSAS